MYSTFDFMRTPGSGFFALGFLNQDLDAPSACLFIGCCKGPT